MYEIGDTRRENLRRILEERKLSQSELARLSKKTPQQVSNMLRGSKAFGQNMARDFEAALKLMPGTLDIPPGAMPQPVKAYIPEEETPPPGYVAIPEYRLEFSAGNGGEAEWVVVEDSVPAWYRRDFFQKNHINPDRCRRAKVTGDSMEPTLCAGDTIMFEEFLEKTPGVNHIHDGAIYAITVEGAYRVKRLAHCKGGILVISDNEGRYPEECYLGEEVARCLRIYGRVIEVTRAL